jgi:hypothetical protein
MMSQLMTGNDALRSAEQVARRGSRAWAFATVAIALIVAGVFLCWYVMSPWVGAAKAMPATVREFVADVARPNIHIREIALSSVADVKRESKLVVLQSTINVDITREESGSSWGIYWGTNTARIRAGATVQYVIDLNNLGTADVEFSEASKTVTIQVPRPILDGTMVDMDPSKVETLDLSGGWMRFDKRDTWDRALAELRPKVIQQASKDTLLQKEANESGREKLEQLFNGLANELRKEGVTVQVRYRD